MANLGDQFEARIDRLIQSERYDSRDAVVEEGLRLLEQDAARRARFEAEIQKGIDDVEAGRTRPAEDVFAELRAKYLAMAAQRSAA